jgi:hypothetical protein
MFGAQTVGKPLIIAEPIAALARPAAPLSKRRRLTHLAGTTPDRKFESILSCMNFVPFAGRPFSLARENADNTRRLLTDLRPALRLLDRMIDFGRPNYVRIA